jgi:hypothetical protein
VRIKIVETHNYEYALSLAVKSESKSREQLEQSLVDLHKLWDVYQGDIRIGVVMAFLIAGVYTLDGYNETENFMAAVIAGKLACLEIFKSTDSIWTAHNKELVNVTTLAEKIGFKIQSFDDTYVYLKKEKVWA